MDRSFKPFTQEILFPVIYVSENEAEALHFEDMNTPEPAQG